jgi:hypothetical protein
MSTRSLSVVLGPLIALLGSGCGSEVDLPRVPAPGDGGSSSIDSPVDGLPEQRDGVRAEVVGVAPGAACVTQTNRAERLPLDLYLMLDSSYSMLEPTATAGVDKWQAVKAALTSFMRAPASAGLGLGIQYFPQVRAELPADCFADTACGAQGPCLLARTCAPADQVVICDSNADCRAGQSCILLGSCARADRYCTDFGLFCSDGSQCLQIPGYCQGRDICDVAAYAAPAVGIQPLPGNVPALVTSLEMKTPVGRTPLGPALQGAVRHLQDHLARNPGRRAAVVLASDGFPVACTPLDIQGVALIAEAAYRASPPVATFTVGVVAPSEAQAATANLASIARAGGTARAHVINTGQNVEQEFLKALDGIRTTALTCEYKLPVPPTGSLDLTRVNVQYTAGSGQITFFGNVPNRAACDPQTDGWFYDVDTATGGKPSSIVMCDSSCARLTADQAGQLDVVLGCTTIVE